STTASSQKVSDTYEVSDTSSAGGHLAAIESLTALLERQRLDYWLFGGWAVDFWVGAVTRAHDDIDIAAWHDDAKGIDTALTSAGWRPAPVENEAIAAGYALQAARLEITFVVADEARRVLIPFPE